MRLLKERRFPGEKSLELKLETCIKELSDVLPLLSRLLSDRRNRCQNRSPPFPHTCIFLVRNNVAISEALILKISNKKPPQPTARGLAQLLGTAAGPNLISEYVRCETELKPRFLKTPPRTDPAGKYGPFLNLKQSII